jgi:Rab3 GTPase-activating protein catalytic subunit
VTFHQLIMCILLQVIHYLDTLRPQQLLGQMLSTAFMASTEALKRTKAGDMPRLLSELDELYSTMNAVLQPLSGLVTAGKSRLLKASIFEAHPLKMKGL